MLRVRVLGELALERDGAPLAPPAGRRLRGLLGWLALHPGPHARGEVAGVLWPDVLDESARTSLRTALAELRRTLGDDALVGTRDTVALAPDVWVDARTFDALIGEDRLDDAPELVRGPLLEDLAEEWVFAERDRRREQVRDALGRLAARAEAAGDLRGAIDRTREQITLDPLAEAAHRDLIRRLAVAGDRPAALAAYAHLRELAALAEGGFAAVASDMNWLASMAGLAQGAALLGDTARAAELYDRLLPYRGRAVLVGRAALCLGPVEMQLGILAGTLGRREQAERHFDAAAAWSERVGARPWAIWTAIHRAEQLGATAGAAAAEAERIGFGRAAARARAVAQAAAGAGA